MIESISQLRDRVKRLYREAKAANDEFKEASALLRRQGGPSAKLEQIAENLQNADADLDKAQIELHYHPHRNE